MANEAFVQQENCLICDKPFPTEGGMIRFSCIRLLKVPQFEIQITMHMHISCMIDVAATSLKECASSMSQEQMAELLEKGMAMLSNVQDKPKSIM